MATWSAETMRCEGLPPPGRACGCPPAASLLGGLLRARPELGAPATRFPTPRPQIIVDVSSLVAQLPHSIVGVFFIRPAGSLIAGDHGHASLIRQQFLEEYGLSEEDGPLLVHLDTSDPDNPFSLANATITTGS